MKLRTDKGKDYDLWFTLEGKGANCSSVLQARCKSKGSRDGACKHIAAAMYALEDLLNIRGEDSVKSGQCVWVRRPTVNTQACAVKYIVIERGEKPSHKKRKRKEIKMKEMSLFLKTQIHQMRSTYKSLPNNCAT